MLSTTGEPAALRSRLAVLLYWITPSLFCLALYWLGLRAWFQRDDFAWLALHLRVHDFPSFLSALFQPLAQGTIRPWSERLYFLAGWWLFGMESPAYRVTAFATMFANLTLLTAITRRITGSTVAGFAAPLLWVANPNLYYPMTWSSAYNQILCAFFLLAALWCWIRYTESGAPRFYIAQWTLFVFGFGALEIQVVYPALAALYAFCRAPRYMRQTVPMFFVSAVYTLLHRASAPAQTSDSYRMYFDAGLPATLWQYLVMSFAAVRYALYREVALWPIYTAGLLAAAGMVAFAIRRMRLGDRLPLFCAGWFFITLLPVLPLKNHVSDYYLTIPVIGVAMLGGWALGATRGHARAVAASIAALWIVPSAWMAQGMTRWYHDMSKRNATLVRSVAAAHRLHPDSILLVRGVDNDLFWQCWGDRPFVALGIQDVYLMSGSEDEILPLRRETRAAQFVLPEAAALAAFRQQRLAVYEATSSGTLRNVTPLYGARLERRTLRLPAYVDFRMGINDLLLGPGWWQAEASHRWMGKRASLQLRPHGTLLLLRGTAPDKRRLTVTAGGISSSYDVNAGTFEIAVAVPPALQGKESMSVVAEVDRVTLLPGDGRDLGLAFTSAEIVP